MKIRSFASVVAAIVGSALMLSAWAAAVPVYVTVTDAKGRPVPGLDRSDFEVRDEGRKVDVTIFETAIQPITTVLMLDASQSMIKQQDAIRRAADQFVNGLLPGDRARIGAFNTKVRFGPADFTSDQDELRRILREDFEYGNATAVWQALFAGLDTLAPHQGRRAVVMFTDGVDTTSEYSQKDLLSRAGSQESVVYAIVVRSRVGGLAGFPPDPALRRVTEETGGGYFELNEWEDLSGAFSRVATELHSQYVLGFNPQALDGKVHRLDVTIKRPGLIARARKSYIAK
jgi:Ca-activated chloride channel homolog